MLCILHAIWKLKALVFYLLLLPLLGIFGVFTDLGISPLTVREVARDKSLAGKYLNNIAVMTA
jgi:O-antigen/teichoic acid export membrane protein